MADSCESRRKLTINHTADHEPVKGDNNLRMARSDSAVFEFILTDPITEEVLDLTDASLVRFSIKVPVTQGQGNADLKVVKSSANAGEITILSPRTDGRIFVELLPEDTVSMDPGEYKYDVEVVFSDGRIQTPVNDHFQLSEDITLDGSPAGQQYCPVLTSKGQYMKRTSLKMARALLKDFKLSPKVQAFTDEELNILLDISLNDFNAFPMFTGFGWNDLDCSWLGLIARGAQVMALQAQSLIEQGREFNINDNGISFTPPGLGAHMLSLASALAAQHEKEKEAIKGNMKPGPQYLGVFRPLSILPSMIRLKHLRERQIV